MELDSYIGLSYDSKQTKFEPRCWNEFWSKHQNILKFLENTDEIDYEQKQKNMINGFVEFVKKWQEKSKKDNFKLTIASDNKVFDGGFINELIFQHYDNLLPFPYNFYTGKYDTFLETHSIQKGLLMVIDSSYVNKDWGYSDAIKQYYHIPEYKKEHNHLPDHDAYTIAFDMQVLLNIGKRKLTRK